MTEGETWVQVDLGNRAIQESVIVISRSPKVHNPNEIFLVKNGNLLGLFLVPGTRYRLSLKESGAGLTVTTRAWSRSFMFPVSVMSLFVCPESHPEVIWRDLIVRSPDEYFYSDSFDTSFWAWLFKRGLFALPHDDVVLIPNPAKKFAFDLTRPVTWHVSRRMRKSGFVFSVIARDKSGSLFDTELLSLIQACAEWHTRNGTSKSTWIDPAFIHNVQCMLETCPEINFQAFTVTDTTSGKIAAISIGYKYRDAFMDFTACTLVRDNRSAGKQILIRQCEYLQARGVKLWYLGFKLPYMDSLSRDAREFSRAEFQSVWDSATR